MEDQDRIRYSRCREEVECCRHHTDGTKPHRLAKLRRLLYAFLICPVLLLVSDPVAAQTTGKLAGKVTDIATGDALIGANIFLPAIATGTITDEEGSFVLLGVPAGEYDVRFSYVGYQTRVVEGVAINSGYTRELDVGLQQGVEFENIVVEYERPLIQKDAIGVPKILTSEEITNLPVRGVQSVAATQAGVVNIPGRDELFLRGGRSRDVAIYIDGVRLDTDLDDLGGFTGWTNVVGLPQAAIQEQEMLIGNISARYGDVMSGVVNIVTKSGGPDYFGSFEALSSEGLDAYGKNLVSGSLGGPFWGDGVSFFVSGEYEDADDGYPRSVELLRVRDDQLARLRRNPQSIRVVNGDQTVEYIDLPGEIPPGTVVPTVQRGGVRVAQVAEDGTVTLSDGTVIQLSGPDAITTFTPILGFELLSPDDFYASKARLGASRRIGSLAGNVTLRPYDSGRFRMGGRYSDVKSEDLGLGLNRNLFAPETYLLTKDRQWQASATYTHSFSNASLIQAQVDYTDRRIVSHDPRFSDSIEDLLFYGDLDHEVNSVNARYKRLATEGDQVVLDPQVSDGNIIPTLLLIWPGGINRGYNLNHHEKRRASVLGMTQVGLHQLEIGAEYESRTRRLWSIGAFSAHQLARYYDDFETCRIGECGPEVPEARTKDIASYADLPPEGFEIGYYGYDVRGLDEVSSYDFAGLINRTAFDVAPWRPRYYGGYAQDKIEFEDIVLNLGLRVDVFDNNALVYRDPFATAPIQRAGGRTDNPASIGSDFAVYFDGDEVVGYRDLVGNFYDSRGEAVLIPEEVTDNGTPKLIDFGGDEAYELSEWRWLFKDFRPHVSVMPRVGVSFPVTNTALVYGRYGVVSRRPSAFNFPAIRLMIAGSGAVPNPDLKPETTIDYEIGYRQRLGTRAAVTLAGFFKQIKEMEAFRQVEHAFPDSYATVLNDDFGTVKGFEVSFELRRMRNVAIDANYTLSFAEGTGSHAGGDRHGDHAHEAPRTIFPLDFDTRHRINANIDVRFGKGQGPEWGSMHPLERVGMNLLVQAASGLPYTERAFQGDLRDDGVAEGPRNGSRMPATGTIDIRVDRRIPIKNDVSLSAFLWVINLFDWENVYNVYGATGEPDQDGFLESEVGQDWLQGQLRPETSKIVYNATRAVPEFYGLARQVQIGLRVTF